MKKEFTKSVETLIAQKFAAECDRRISAAAQEKCDEELEVEITYETVDDQETIYLDTVNPATKQVRIYWDDDFQEWKPFLSLTLEMQCEVIDWMVDDLECVV